MISGGRSGRQLARRDSLRALRGGDGWWEWRRDPSASQTRGVGLKITTIGESGREIPRPRCGLGMTTLVGSSFSFFGELALENVLYQRFQHASREQVVNLRFEALEHLPHDLIHSFRVRGCGFLHMRAKVRRRHQERNPGQRFAVWRQGGWYAAVCIARWRLKCRSRRFSPGKRRRFCRRRLFDNRISRRGRKK